MPARIPWNRHEVALLINAYFQVAEGADLGQTAKELSFTLRKLAIQAGQPIDDTYRNVNGMKMQLANVQYLFTRGEKGLSGASTMIRRMYELYNTDSAAFQTILKEAIQLTGSNASIEDAFFAYAGEHTGLSPEMLTDYLQKATEHCHLKQSLLGMTDVKGIRNALQNVSEGKLLRFRYGKDAQAIRNVTQLYYTFIKSHPELTEEPVIKAEEPDAEAIVSEPSGNSQPDAAATISVPSVDPQPDDTVEVAEESSDKSGMKVPREEEPKYLYLKYRTVKNKPLSEPKLHHETDSSGKITVDWDYDWHRSDLHLVDLTVERSYNLTQPEAYEYKGVTHRVNTWENLYVDFCGALYKDYPNAFMNLKNGSIPDYEALVFADEWQKSKMQAPRRFAPGFYLEANMDATSFVHRICELYRLFRLGNRLKISYIHQDDHQDEQQDDAKKTPAPEETDEEWIIHELRTKNIPYVDNRAAGGCLWIASDLPMPISPNEAADRGYRLRFSQDGCKAFPNRPILWTKDQPKQPAKTSLVKPTSDKQILLDAFKQFMVEEGGLSERTANSYCSSIRTIEAYIQRNNLYFSLLTTDVTGAQRIFDILMARPDFEQINANRHNQLSAGLTQYIDYLRLNGSNSTHHYSRKQPSQKTIIETVFDVLRQAGKPMTVSEIYQAIIRDDLYPFGAQDPQSVVYSKINIACRQTDEWIKEGRDVLIRSETDGKKMYQAMSAKEAKAYMQPPQKETESKTDSSWTEYETVLRQAFPKGFQKESGLDMKKLRKRWAEIHGAELEDSDDTVRQQMAAHCVDTGKRWYLAELLLSDEDRQTVLNYIDRVLGSGKPVLYYSSIYAALEHQLESTVLTEDLLISYLQATCQDRYILQKHYLTNDRHAQVDLADEIKDVMIAHGSPIHTDELKQALHHLPPDQVEHELHIHSEFIMDAFHMYFHESMAELTEAELDQIAAFIQEELDDQGYMIGDWIQRKLARLYPETAERLSFLTVLGVRGAVAYKLRDRFTFTGPVITPRGKAMNMIDVFAMFCQHHTPFTLDDLTSFARECDTTIYLDTVHRNCVRVSENEFVSTDAVHWDIPHIDAAIALRCPGKYVSLKNIQYFDAFPYVGYSWNSYLLEQYAATVSKDFTLMHSSYAKNTTSGAIVRRNAGLESFDEVLADILTNAPVDLEKDPCLKYLADEGYITRRKLSNINEIITRAKVLRSQKG